MDDVDRVLFVCRELDVYKIPPRTGAGGHRSGEWRVDDKIFTARCRVMARGQALEIRLEDTTTGDVFGVCPVPRGQLHLVVEPAADSSRNFVVRLEDAASKRHAFVGINFAERSTAFDFSVALSDHEKQLQRADKLQHIEASDDPLAAAAKSLPEAAALYQKQDLALEEGTTIRLAVRRPEGGAAGGFLSRLPVQGGALASPGKGIGLAAPPAPSNGASTAPAAPRAFDPPPSAALQGAPVLPPPASGGEAGWATFD